MNGVNGSVALRTAHKLRSAAAALLADSEAQSDPRLAGSLMYEAGEITKRAAAIEEQVKPAIEEPKDFGSIVRAISGVVSVSGTLWQMAPGHGEHYWEDEHGCVEVWSELADVEVLRVGLGDEKPLTASDLSRMSIEANAAKLNSERQAYANGARDVAARIHFRLRSLLDEAITSERKNAYEKAIQAVEELAP